MTTNPIDNGTIIEACRPYDLRPSGDPVDLWAVIDRLTPDEQRRMLMAFATWEPRGFEDKLRRLWAERPARHERVTHW